VWNSEKSSLKLEKNFVVWPLMVRKAWLEVIQVLWPASRLKRNARISVSHAITLHHTPANIMQQSYEFGICHEYCCVNCKFHQTTCTQPSTISAVLIRNWGGVSQVA
jgi:hypothetical protein